MKLKITSLIITAIFIINISFSQYAFGGYSKKYYDSSNDDFIRAVSIMGGVDFKNFKFSDANFNTAFVYIQGVRDVKPPFKTNFKLLKKMDSTINLLESKKINYVLFITSGPGFSHDGKTSTMLNRKQEQIYYAKMLKEISKRYLSKKYFLGVSVSMPFNVVAENKYYSTLKILMDRVKTEFPDVPLVVTLHPTSFKKGFSDVPDFVFSCSLINCEMYINSKGYPGKCLVWDKSQKMNKNIILKKLEILKELQNEKKSKIIISLKTQWVDNSNVFLQDTFEVLKIMNFYYNICYGNSKNSYDFSNKDSIIKIITRHSYFKLCLVGNALLFV